MDKYWPSLILNCNVNNKGKKDEKKDANQYLYFLIGAVV